MKFIILKNNYVIENRAKWEILWLGNFERRQETKGLWPDFPLP